MRCARRLILLLAILALLGLPAPPAAAQAADPPIVFGPGNGETAALWLVQIWRFESNGHPRDRLWAIDMKYPTARSVDDKAQVGRSSSLEAMRELAAFVAEVRQRTGAG